MSFHKSRLAGISATILVALVFLVFISLIIASKVILPSEIRSCIKEISKDTGYKVEIKKIEFDFFYGLKGEEIEIFDPLSPANPMLRVENVSARPNVLSSLINWKIKVREITIDNPIFSLTEEELDNLIKLIKEKKEESKRKRERPLPIEIEHLVITGTRIELTPQILIRSKKIEVDLGNANLRKERTVKLSGSINLQNEEIEVYGEIKPFLNTPTGELKMNLSDLNTQSFSNAIRLPEKLNIFLGSKFQVSDKIISQGVIDFRSAQEGKKNSPFSGKLEYDLAYDKSTDTALFNSLNLGINELIRISFAGRIEKLRKEAIFKLKGKAENIQIENISRWFPSPSQIEFSGDAKPNNIEITGSRKDKNISLTGKVTLREVNVKDEKSGFQINGLEGGFDFEQNFGSRVLRGFFAQGNFSLRSLWITTLNVNKVSGNIQFVPSENGITFKSKGLYYKNLSFSKALVESGSVSRLEFNSGENSDWTLNVYSIGSQFKIPGEEAYIRQFQTDIHIRKNERIDVWGNLSGKRGRYKDTSFPTLSTDFKFDNDLLKLTNLKIAIETYGELKTEKLDFILQRPYTLTFTQGSFSGFNQGVKSKGIKGEFRFNVGNKKKPMWGGNVFISEADIFKSQLKNLSIQINLSSEEINLEKISGRFLGGDLGGSVWVKTAESPPLISSEIEFRNLNPLNKPALFLERLNFRFKGELEKGVIPQGSGEVISHLKLGQGSTVHPLSSQMEVQTIGETLILRGRFIENERGATVKFTGKMENSLDRSRRLQLDLPEVPLTSMQEILSPILPGVLRQGEVAGSTSLNLVLTQSNKEEISWDGKLSLKDASFNGKISSGVRFLVKDINGTIHLMEDESGLENPLDFSTRGYSKPDKKAFETFLDALTQNRVENRGDILKIKEIEYGFLRLEDIEFALELGRDKLNIRRFESKLYGGNVFGTGLFEFDGKERKYDFSFLFKDVSLKKASNSIPSTKDYITGRMNGIGWLSDEGEKLSTLNGSFSFWAIKSEKEPRTIGKALLTQLGVKEKFLLRSSRKYDKGEMYVYIKDGVVTFKGLEISHSILGIKDLFIQVDPKRNSISVSHFLSVIRETAKRASEGRLKIEIKSK